MAARVKTSRESREGKKAGGKKRTKKTNDSPDKEQEKRDKKEQAKIRNGKAKNAGARLGGFLRSSLSFHRSKSSKSLFEAFLSANSDILNTNVSRSSSAWSVYVATSAPSRMLVVKSVFARASLDSLR